MAAPMTCAPYPSGSRKSSRRPTSGRKAPHTRWCARGWAHPEAVAVVEALWLTWEAGVADSDPHAMAAWLRRGRGRLDPPCRAWSLEWGDGRDGRRAATRGA